MSEQGKFLTEKTPNYLQFTSLEELKKALKLKTVSEDYEYVNGGLSAKPTAGGTLWQNEKFIQKIDISQIKELQNISIEDDVLTIGGAVTISKLIQFLERNTIHAGPEIVNYLKKIGNC